MAVCVQGKSVQISALVHVTKFKCLYCTVYTYVQHLMIKTPACMTSLPNLQPDPETCKACYTRNTGTLNSHPNQYDESMCNSAKTRRSPYKAPEEIRLGGQSQIQHLPFLLAMLNSCLLGRNSTLNTDIYCTYLDSAKSIIIYCNVQDCK